ncbi:hypothetical protein ACP4OV_023455 [Aristida adscensionis]
MSTYVFAASAAVLLAVAYVVKNRRGRKLPPSPPSLPLIGHLHLIGRLPHRSLHKLHLRYGGGDGLLLLQLGRRRTLVVSTAAAAADLFKNHDHAFASRPRSAAADKLMYGASNISFAPYGDYWRRAKKVAVVHLLSPRRVESFAPAVALRDLLCGYTNAVVTRAATGAAGAAAERLERLLGNSATLLTGLQAEDVLPDAAARAVRWATGLEKKLDETVEAWDRFLSEIVAAHTERVVKPSREEEDFMDVLLRLREEGTDGLELTDDRIKAITEDMIAAATATSSVALEWAMSEVVANPRVMAKLQDELGVLVTAKNPTITESELNRTEYLKAAVKETLRLHPPAPLLLPHLSTAPATVRGYEIPAGTTLFVNAWAIGRDPAAWDAPEEFRPERFLGGGAAAAAGSPPPVDVRGADYQLVPFGAGRRVCPGVNFALPVVELALASLLCHFDWALPAGLRAADLDMSEAPGLSTPRKVPLVLVPKCKVMA